MSRYEILGADAIAAKGWFKAHLWLILRRLSQLTILGLFLISPWLYQKYEFWLVQGNLASSLTLDVLPLTDPYLLLQMLFAGHLPETTAVVGALIVLAFYLLVGGRVYCSWVCPVNLITDASAWLQDKLGIKGTAHLSRSFRYWLLGMTLVMAALAGTMVWELVNPVSMVFRALVFGMGMAWFVLLALFLFDLFVARRGWCGHLCPVGAFYSLLGKISLVRVSASARSACNDCMECYAVCPEPQVIKPALKGEGKGVGPIIQSANCTNCGRCIDICSKDVFKFSTRSSEHTMTKISNQREVTP